MAKLIFDIETSALPRENFDQTQQEYLFREAEKLSDDAAREFLIALKGIGVWTADIYLLSALRRPDVWPIGDLALAVAVQEVKRLRSRPSPERLEKLSTPWRPYRAVAARLFWHAYLSKRGQNSVTISL